MPKSSIGCSQRAKRIRSFIAMDVLEAAQQLRHEGHDVISLSIGEPDFPAPKPVKDAAVRAIRQDFTKYTHSLGLPELREAICRHYAQRYRVSLDPDQVLVTSGTSPAMLLVFAALLDPKDEVILSDPHYPCYSNFIRFLDGKPVFVRIYEDDGFQYRPQAVKNKLSSKTKAIFINSPSNPTGCTLSSEVMKKLASFGKFIVSDEIYHGLTYEGEERSILEFTDRAFVLNGFSKAYAMTGFRLGYCIFPKAFIQTMKNMAQNFYISASSFIQAAGLAALTQTQKQQKKMKQIFAARRTVMLKGLKELGFKIAAEPNGAFYVFVNAKNYTQDSHAFAFNLLKQAKVGITPGVDFGPSGEGFLRFSYATDIVKIREALRRIAVFMRTK